METELIDYESVAMWVIERADTDRYYEIVESHMRTCPESEASGYAYALACLSYARLPLKPLTDQFGIVTSEQFYRLLRAGKRVLEDTPLALDEFDKPYDDPVDLARFILNAENDSYHFDLVRDILHAFIEQGDLNSGQWERFCHFATYHKTLRCLFIPASFGWHDIFAAARAILGHDASAGTDGRS